MGGDRPCTGAPKLLDQGNHQIIILYMMEVSSPSAKDFLQGTRLKCILGMARDDRTMC